MGSYNSTQYYSGYVPLGTDAMTLGRSGGFRHATLGQQFVNSSDPEATVTLLHEPTHELYEFNKRFRQLAMFTPDPNDMTNPTARQLEADIDNYAKRLGKRIKVLPEDMPWTKPDDYIPK